jgi:hypothetical protein
MMINVTAKTMGGICHMPHTRKRLITALTVDIINAVMVDKSLGETFLVSRNDIVN